LKGYDKLFVCHTTDNLPKCEQFISGLLHDCKSNIERMTERIPESDYDQLHHFISHSPWDAMAVMNSMSQKLHATLSSIPEDKTRPTSLGLIIDESGWEKSGKKSVGVARQYIGQVGKISNGQVGVFAGLSDGTQVGLVQGRLYLPKEWTDDPERCDKAGIPKSEQVYLTKPELSIEILKSLPDSVTYDWVGGDDLYGNSITLRKYLYDKKQSFVLDVSKQIIKQISEEGWQTITHRNGTKGPLIRKACIMDVYVWKSKRKTQVEALQLIISTEEDGSEVKYSLCYHPTQKLSLATALYQQMQRYWVERAFQNVKEHLGLNQYQVRSWKAWHHHIALTLMALHFLLQLQKENKTEMPLLSIPDIKLVFAKKLLNNLHSDNGLIQALKIRHKKRKDDIERRFNKFYRVPK